MLLFILIIPFIFLRIYKYNFKFIIKAYDLYPIFIVELIHSIFQINAFAGNFSYVKYATYIQYAFNICLIIPIIYRKLYYQGIIGAVCVMIGSIMNKAVIFANNSKMPVYPTLSKLTGYYKEGMLSQGIDNLHIMMNSSTSLNFLGDYIDLGFCILSIGDIFIHCFVAIIVFYTVKDLNYKKHTI